jgi:hypothetical protein
MLLSSWMMNMDVIIWLEDKHKLKIDVIIWPDDKH